MRACVLWCQQNDIGELLAIEFDEEAPTEYETDGGRYLYLIYLE